MARSFAGTNRYQVVRPLGEGSFGAVYDVLDRERGAHVALKVLTRFDASTLYRFKGEFRAFADVHHPNLVELYDLGSDGGEWFFTMELVDGDDWLTFVRERPRRFDENRATQAAPLDLARMRTEDAGPRCNIHKTVASALQLGGAVRALHAAGIVHRDVKPSNVLVESSGRVVLVDFGLARPIASGRTQNSGIDAVGTPAYMAPEQATQAEVTEAADWYAVGVMLFEALTGHLPFEGKPLEIISEKQKRDAPRVSDLVAGCPRDLDDLCAALLSRGATARPRGEAVLQALGEFRPRIPPPAAQIAPPAAERSPFVGRRQPLRALEAAFDRAAEGATQIALLHGPSGIGKSALVRALVEGAVEAKGGLVLAGRCYEREAVSYKAFDSAIDGLSRYLVKLPTEQAAEVLPRDAAALARVFPVLDRVPTIAQAPRRALDVVDAQRLRSRAFSALRELLVRLGDRRPVLLVLDDFQWADGESLALLRDITHGDVTPAMLVVVAYREEDVGRSPPLDALLESFRIRGTDATVHGQAVGMEEIKLEPLTMEESRELAAIALGRQSHDVRIGSIASESGGSPFFLGELVQFALSAAGPGAGDETTAIRLATVLERRLGQLGAGERRLLEVLAVAGTPIERRVACQAAQFEAPEAEPLFRALQRAKLVRTAGTEREDLLECSHNRIREATLAAMSEMQRRQHHQHVAAALQTLREADPEALFLHYEAAGHIERAAEFALVSAERAAGALAFEHAAGLYESALALLRDDAPDRNAIIVRMAEALMRAGHGVESADAFLRAIDGAARSHVLAYRHRAAEQLLFCGELDRGMRIMSEICQQTGITIPRSRLNAIAQLVLLMIVFALRGRRYHPRDPAKVTAAELTSADVCWSMAGGLSLVDQVIARPFALRAVLTAYAVGDEDRIVRALVTEAGFRSSEGEKARRATDSLFAAARTIAQTGESANTRVFRKGVEGWAKYFLGDWRTAKPALDQAHLELTASGSALWERDTMAIYSLMVRIYLGELRELVHLSEQRVYDARNRSDLFAETILVASRVNARWLLDDTPATKRREVDDALRRWGQPGRFQIQHWYALQSLAQTDLYEGEPLNALRRLDDAWPALRRSFLLRVQNIRIEARSMRAFAALRLAANEAEREAMVAMAHREATAIAREGVRWGTPIAILIRAAITLLRRDDAAALVAIDQATRLFDAEGMSLHVAAARSWRAAITGGDEGRALQAQADAYFHSQGVKEPERVGTIFVPR